MNLPEAHVLASDLRKATLADTARRYGVTPSAICVKLRRAGMPRGTSPGRPQPPVSRPVVVEREPCGIDKVIRITHSGAKVALPRISYIDSIR